MTSYIFTILITLFICDYEYLEEFCAKIIMLINHRGMGCRTNPDHCTLHSSEHKKAIIMEIA